MTSRKKQILGFDDTWLMFLGIPLTCLIMPLFTINLSEFTWSNYFFKFNITGIYTVIFWFAFREIFKHSRTKYPTFSQVGVRLIYQMVLVAVCYVVVDTLVDFPLEHLLFSGKEMDGDDQLVPTTATIIMIAFLCSVYEGIYFYQQLKQSIQEKEQLQRENIISQLEGLKNQVNPHFLFNSLNTLSYLIPEDSDRAVNFVQQLSKVYRYILEIRSKKLIPLKEELDFLHAYIFLLKERFEENLHVEINIPEPQLALQIVPLSLQILFENAIKHNIISSKKPLLIEVFVDEAGKLIVQNNLQQKKQRMDSTKVGLQNIKNRYRFFSDEAVQVFSTSTSFIVALPLIDHQLST